jgi:hypothetical protein
LPAQWFIYVEDRGTSLSTMWIIFLHPNIC